MPSEGGNLSFLLVILVVSFEADVGAARWEYRGEEARLPASLLAAHTMLVGELQSELNLTREVALRRDVTKSTDSASQVIPLNDRAILIATLVKAE